MWFFAVSASLLVVVLYAARNNATLMLSAAIGSAAFFFVYGLRETANKTIGGELSNLSRFVYLEVLDASFSFDGVVGAYGFTSDFLLIVLGLGVGAVAVRELTVRGVDFVGKLIYLRNGAMTSMGFLGVFMLLESLGVELPFWVPILVTLGLVGFTLIWSIRGLKDEKSLIGRLAKLF